MPSASLTDKLSRLPASPGVYIMKNRQGKILYIGKAKNLKNRVRSYFNKSQKDIKTRFLVSKIYDLEFFVTGNEVESLILEANLIQKEHPPYNIRLKDDKRYPYLGFTNEAYSVLKVVRNKNPLFSEYFGPYTSVYSMRQTLDFINKNFKLRKCSKKLEYGKKVGRTCLYYQMGQCLGPCQGTVEPDEYEVILNNVRQLLLGEYDELRQKLTEQMKSYSAKTEFEKAAELKKILNHLQIISEKQNVNLADAEFADAFYFGQYESLVVIFILFIRKEKITDRRTLFYENILGLPLPEIMSSVLNQFYSDTDYLPDKILISEVLSQKKDLEDWFMEKFGKETKIMPFKSLKGEGLLKIMQTNSRIAAEEYLLNQLKGNKDKGLYELKNLLHLKRIPFHIEGFDISHTDGQYPVASMVCFKNGMPAKKEYRKFRMRSVEGINDFAMIEEAVGRRYQRLLNEGEKLPDLILIDGGPQQLKFAVKSLAALELDIPVISLAKKEELIYRIDSEAPLKLPKHSKALQLLQFVRDESHRFAVTFHKHLRDKNFLK